jgi:5-oxoprolinase (ATP-hydrolysing) subunit C
MSVLRVIASGPGNTLQDRGRFGHLRFGVTPAGPMDWVRFAEANRLAGNPDGSAAIEIGLGGMTIGIEGAARRIGVSADGFLVERDGKAMPASASFLLETDQTLSVRAGRQGSFAMVAIAGGFDLPPVLGSLSTHLRSGIGPLQGQGLGSGMVLPLNSMPPDHATPLRLLAAPDDPSPLRFVPGPQEDYFNQESLDALCREHFRLSPQSDRMGYRLVGPRLNHAKGADIVSDGIVLGAMQVPGDGQMIILMADRQPTGGYPKIGTVIRADLPRLAQMRPGNAMQFQRVTIAEAVDALHQRRKALEQRLAEARPLVPGPDLEALMSGNHASGMQSALDADLS